VLNFITYVRLQVKQPVSNQKEFNPPNPLKGEWINDIKALPGFFLEGLFR
jgi:hypothetical protein